ncbi:BglG family transcription antiterminator [Floccifex sp.]|uniref:BglG family transcription antiterminator n=1 Tax=Floccifex sp. TaxID=2815810 RepID=UPI002A752FA4|nr:PRD domain-containing protein [Floccifex sp.]MDD7280752.1 PRD domain-containing protein [Erysipelotrichaceae bacterium]MDY2957613.1 PRD domain-containing protein [Floccifex sp.]
MNQRIVRIIQLLLNQEEPITVDQIKDVVQVSNKTVRMDLKVVQEICNSFDIELIKKQGTGIQMIGSDSAKLSLKNKFCSQIETNQEYSPVARRSYIALRILTATDPCKSSMLGEELYVSKATINKDIHSLKDYFIHKKLDIISNNMGIYVKGKERHIRDCIFDFMIQNEKYNKLSELILNPNYKPTDYFIYPSIDYTDTNFYDLFNVVLNTNLSLFNNLSFDRMQRLLTRVFISYIRILDECPITLSENFIKKLEVSSYYHEAKIICQAIEKAYSITIDEKEVHYLQVHIQSIVSESKETSTNASAKIMAYQLIHGWMKIFDYPFDKDEELFNSLYQHCKPAITRFEHNIPMENTLLPVIKKQFRNTFLITRDCCKSIEKSFGYFISDDEIAYLTLHLVNALDRQKKKINVLLISENSVGVNKLLQQRLNTLVPYMNVSRIIDVLSYRDEDISEYDILLSTTSAAIITDKPMIKISPILDEADILKLNTVGYEYYKKKNDPIQHIIK